MKNLVISVKRWLHGGRSRSVLRNETGSMCCLGFLARDCGASVDQIVDLYSPQNLPQVKWPKKLLRKSTEADRVYHSLSKVNTELTKDMIKVNDDKTLSLTQKKSKLRKLFSQIGYRLTFK